jgi:hypothetical protein
MRPKAQCQPSAHSLIRRAMARTAAAAAIVLSFVGTASAGPAELSPEIRAMAQRLAQRDPIQSCAADSSTMLPAPAMFAPGGAVGGGVGDSGPLTVGGPGGLWVQCSLPYTNGKSGGDCEGKHIIDWNVINGTGAKVTAELLALDASGNVLKAFQVKKGETVQLNSRLSPTDWKFTSSKGTYDIFSPVGLLKVTAEMPNGDKADAYCTSIPWTDVVKPSGGTVVADATGTGTIDFKAAVPRTNPAQLHLTLDGVNVLPQILSAHPTGCPYNVPCGGTFTNPAGVTYSNVIIDIAPNIQTRASNTISGSIAGLGCGGHFVQVTTAADPAFRRTSLACNLDDLADRGNASVFDIKLTKLGDKTGNDLVDGLVTTQIPTEVVGEVCSGTNIIAANINGKVLDVTNPTTTTGPGGDIITVDFDEFLDQTNLSDDFKGLTTDLGTFAPGSNRLLIAATEAKGTKAYERLMFGVGDNIKPLGINASALFTTKEVTAETQQMVQQAVQQKLNSVLGPSETTIKNAFVVALSEEGAQTILQNLCDAKVIPDPDDASIKLSTGEFFDKIVTKTLSAFDYDHPFTTFTFGSGIPCVCNTDVHVFLDNISVGDQVLCPIEFFDGEIHVSLQLPDVDFRIHAIGPEESCAVPVPFPPFVLPSTTSVDAFANVGFHDVTFTYKLTEQDILDSTTTKAPDAFQLNARTDFSSGGGPSYGVASDICNWFLIGFVDVLTFGGVNLEPLLYPNLDFDKTIDFKANLAPAEPDAIPMKGFNIEKQTDGVYHQELKGDINAVSDIHITGPDGDGKGAGITVGLKGTFSTTSISPFVEGNPGFQAVEPNLLTLRQMQDQGAKDALIGLSSDTINMFFESLGSNGEMRVPNSDDQGCFATGATVGSLLPADCETIDVDPLVTTDDVANAALRGYCHAIKGDNCSTIAYAGNPDPNITSGERGVCDGGSGATCSAVFGGDLVRLGLCTLTPNLNLHANQNFMFCATGDIPVIKFPTAAQNEVPTNLQINDISVSLVLDRGLNGTPNGKVDGSLATLPGCFSGTQTNADCNLLSACLDVNMFFSMTSLQPGNAVCADGKAGLQAGFTGILPNLRKIGEVCGGDASTTDDDALDNASSKSAVSEPIGQNAAAFAPPICGTGLSVPQLFTCDSVAIVGLDDVTVQPGFREFLALTCAIH